jgi:hypothetical protein
MCPVTALGDFIKQRIDELDLGSFAAVARRTAQYDKSVSRKAAGLNADSIRRIALGERTTIHERTLDLLALALETNVSTLRAHAEDRTRDTVHEYRVPPEAHSEYVTSRIQHSWSEVIRAEVEGLRGAWRSGYDQCLRDHDLDEDPVALAEAMSDGVSDPDSLPARSAR